MPGWLLAALALLGPTAIRRAGPLARRVLPLAGAAGLGAIAGGVGIPGVDLFPEEKPKRRRRRRALTASDRADIAFIAGLLGPTAGRNFAITVATRT